MDDASASKRASAFGPGRRSGGPWRSCSRASTGPRPASSDAAAAQAGLAKRTAFVDREKISVCTNPPKTAGASHGGFDNDVPTMNDILRRILGGTPPAKP